MLDHDYSAPYTFVVLRECRSGIVIVFVSQLFFAFEKRFYCEIYVNVGPKKVKMACFILECKSHRSRKENEAKYVSFHRWVYYYCFFIQMCVFAYLYFKVTIIVNNFTYNYLFLMLYCEFFSFFIKLNKQKRLC